MKYLLFTLVTLSNLTFAADSVYVRECKQLASADPLTFKLELVWSVENADSSTLILDRSIGDTDHFKVMYLAQDLVARSADKSTFAILEGYQEGEAPMALKIGGRMGPLPFLGKFHQYDVTCGPLTPVSN